MTEDISGFTDCMQKMLHHLFTPLRLMLLLQGILVLPAVLLLAGCNEKPQQHTPPRPVRTVTVPAPSQAGMFTQTGEIRPHDEVTLGFRLDGRLLTRSVDVGDHVAVGQVLGTLENSTSQNQLDSARADLDSARAAEQLAVLNLRRMTQLMPSGAIARVQLDTARSDWQAAASRRRSSEATLNTARENLSWTRLTAPATGVVTQVSAEPGQVVSAGQTVVTLAVSSGRDAVIDVADPQAFSRRTGQFRVSLLADPTASATGTLRDISPQADAQTRTWRVRVTLENPPPAMALGASVQVGLYGTGPAVMCLPASALTRIQGKPAVFVVDTAGRRLQLRPVTLAGFTAADMLVSAGLRPGEHVVTAGVSKLREGEKVTVGEEAE
ncbi:efflux RND transporter periplasmic adaptor subunit [Rouxiella badensis]|uniref:efflux RND transporter periplasmic adaptor subunit n=1 Tax=Rouxiella badensis TaxID=1646377 RepID=UPI0013EF2BA3|nr:efflux RND transporter periplasmic adaptor subunit [Rouxiella badensis]QII38305.1 efflux RND transporter periplasmic adaptor subunit [Rouxiella badensis]